MKMRNDKTRKTTPMRGKNEKMSTKLKESTELYYNDLTMYFLYSSIRFSWSFAISSNYEPFINCIKGKNKVRYSIFRTSALKNLSTVLHWSPINLEIPFMDLLIDKSSCTPCHRAALFS